MAQASLRLESDIIERADAAAASISDKMGVDIARATVLRSAVQLGLERLEARTSLPTPTDKVRQAMLDAAGELAKALCDASGEYDLAQALANVASHGHVAKGDLESAVVALLLNLQVRAWRSGVSGLEPSSGR